MPRPIKAGDGHALQPAAHAAMACDESHHVDQPSENSYKIILAGSKGVGQTTLMGILGDRCHDVDAFGDPPSVTLICRGVATRKERTKLTVRVAEVSVKVCTGTL